METMELKYDANSRDEKRVKIQLETQTKSIQEENIEGIINEYEEYVKEKDSSTRYRLAFTISPICSNVLYNTLTEIVYKEGSDECKVIPTPKKNNDIRGILAREDTHSWGYTGITDENISNYWKMKYGSDILRLNTVEMIRDTSYSHSEIGGFVYHCGIDIFNNHLLRKKSNIAISKPSSENENNDFNTLADKYREALAGKTVMSLTTSFVNSGDSVSRHIYFYDTLKRFPIALRDGIKEDENGWFGFINPCTLPIKNYNGYSLNKCMNNNKASEFYDFYPDRSLYSFTPKFNKYRNRYENNWDYCLTFPYRNIKNEVVYNKNYDVIGIKAYLATNFSEETVDNLRSDSRIYFRTDIRHNLSNKSQIEFTLIDENNWKNEKIPFLLSVETIGTPYGTDETHYFSVAWHDIEGYFDEINTATEIRLRKKENGALCDYYFRVFRKLPNFNYANVSQDEEITEEDLKKSKGFNSNLNTMGFGRNIYDADISQIVYNDVIDVKGLRDNLNREISEIYLTVVKNNKGYKEWYESEEYSSSAVTYSHCFGKVTCGLDLTPDVFDYNVHLLHNIDLSNSAVTEYCTHTGWMNGITTSPRTLLLNDNLSGDTNGVTINDDEFLGDIVEFSPNTLYETVLEYVYHRFNTVQREYSKDKRFYYLIYEDILMDDNDRDIRGDENGKFNKFYIFNTTSPNDTGNTYPINLNPEGYWYNPHYRIKLKEYSNEINEGYHTKITLDAEQESIISDDTIILYTDKNYYLEIGKELYFYNGDKEKKIIRIREVEGKDYRKIILNNDGIVDLDKWTIFKPNIEKPKYAYDFEDGTGRYVWRNVLSTNEIFRDSELYDSIFTNNATYIHKHINLFLKRQNPFGEYPRPNGYLFDITTPFGKINDYSSKYYVKQENYDKC